MSNLDADNPAVERQTLIPWRQRIPTIARCGVLDLLQ
jgi:hypothetical protein